MAVWMDWDGDGDFDGIDEKVADLNDSGGFPSFLLVTVPQNAKKGNLLGVRIRLSNEDNLSPYGPANSGEVEDYLIGIECPQVHCLPISGEENRE